MTTEERPRKRREWTYAELREAHDAFEAGETWGSIGKRYGVSRSTVRTEVNRFVGKPEKPKGVEARNEDKVLAAIAIRNRDKISWSMVNDQVCYPSGALALRLACTRYCQKNKMDLFTGFPKKRRTKWDRTQTDTHCVCGRPITKTTT